MVIKIPILILLLTAALAVDISLYRNHIPSTSFTPRVISPIPEIPQADLPIKYWWGDVNGTNYLTYQRNQHIPIYCGSCWAFASTSALSDRIKIRRKAQWPDVNLSPQVIISCVSKGNGCDGGDTRDSY
jgi:cathepsin X